MHFDRGCILISIVEGQTSLCPHYLVSCGIGRTKTAHETGQPLSWKTEDGRIHFLDFSEPFVASAGRHAENLQWLLAEKVPRGVDTINTQIPKGAAALFALQSDIRSTRLHAKDGIEVARLSNSA